MSACLALALSLLAEVPIVCMADRLFISRWRLLPLGVALLATLLTQPIAWRVALVFATSRYVLLWIAIELSVVLLETALFRATLWKSWKLALAASFAANIASASLSILSP